MTHLTGNLRTVYAINILDTNLDNQFDRFFDIGSGADSQINWEVMCSASHLHDIKVSPQRYQCQAVDIRISKTAG